MIRYLSAIAILVLATACGRLPVTEQRGAEPLLRIGLLVDVDAVRINGGGGVSVMGARALAAEPDEQVRLSAAEGGVQVDGRTGFGRAVTIESNDPVKHILVNGRPYRGSMEVLSHGSKLTVVNIVATDAYLRGVVGVEMGSRQRNELAALEAQAIASRTYALKNRGRFRVAGFDMRAGVQDQAYMGVDRETELGSAAVRRTAGLVVTYRGDLVSAFYHSTCGYSTASPSEAFRTVQTVPYLTPVSDRRPSGGYYCDISPRFRWSVEWDGAELRDILRSTIPTVIGVDADLIDEVHALHVHAFGPSRRVTELRVQVGDGEIPVYGPDLRRVFLTPEGRLLGSTAIEVTYRHEANGGPKAMMTGAGWGHGVGMCQWGAIGRARAGQSAREILTTYYSGTRIERRY